MPAPKCTARHGTYWRTQGGASAWEKPRRALAMQPTKESQREYHRKYQAGQRELVRVLKQEAAELGVQV